jgi:hypothetical protein
MPTSHHPDYRRLEIGQSFRSSKYAWICLLCGIQNRRRLSCGLYFGAMLIFCVGSKKMPLRLRFVIYTLVSFDWIIRCRGSCETRLDCSSHMRSDMPVLSQ